MPENILDKESTLSHIAWYWGFLAESSRTKGQREFKVYIPDITPMRNGDVINKGSTTKSKLFNVVTQSWEENEAHMSQTVVCEYLGFESSREVPDMYKGQQVLVMNYGRDDRWFWIPLERDDYIKTFEHVLFRCADIAVIHKKEEEEPDKEREVNLTRDNTYFLEIDTKWKKHVFISTAGTDGEKYRYFFKIDAKEHTIELWDCLTDKSSPDKLPANVPHNSIKIESDPSYSQGQMLKGRITLQNEAGCSLILEDEDMKIHVPRNLTVEIGKNSVVNIDGDSSLTVTGNRHVKTKTDFWHDVLGVCHEEIWGQYTQHCHVDRQEEVNDFYSLFITNDFTEQCLNKHVTILDSRDDTVTNTYKIISKDQIGIYNSQKSTISTTYTILADVISMQGNSAATYGGKAVTLGAGSSITFAAGAVSTKSHIFGCCGCPGH